MVYEDADLLVINKLRIGGSSRRRHRDGTLVNALLHHAPELAALPRAGLVHRLDKDTNRVAGGGAQPAGRIPRWLKQLQARAIEREYWRWVNAFPWRWRGGCAAGRHPVDRQRMAVTRGVNLRSRTIGCCAGSALMPCCG